MPDIDATIYRKYRDKGVLVFGVHEGEPANLLADFVKQTGVTFPIVRDPRATVSRFAFPNGVGYPYPRDVVIDKNLRVRSIRNSFNRAAMDTLIQQLLAE